MKYYKLIILAILVVVISGCALTDEQVPLNYVPKSYTNLGVHPSKTIFVNEVTDSRGEDPKLIAHKINEDYENATGTFLAEKSMSSILKNGLELSLKQAGYHLLKNSPYELNATLLSIHTYVDAGAFSCVQHMAIQMEFTLVDRKTDNEVWNQIFTGRGIYSSQENVDQPIRNLFVRATNNLFKQLLSDDSFRVVMKK